MGRGKWQGGYLVNSKECVINHLSILVDSWSIRWYMVTKPRGSILTKIVHACACQTSKIRLSQYQFFFAKSPTHWFTIFEEYIHWIHPIYVIWAPSSLMQTQSLYQIFRNSIPKGKHIYTYTMSMCVPRVTLPIGQLGIVTRQISMKSGFLMTFNKLLVECI